MHVLCTLGAGAGKGARRAPRGGGGGGARRAPRVGWEGLGGWGGGGGVGRSGSARALPDHKKLKEKNMEKQKK